MPFHPPRVRCLFAVESSGQIGRRAEERQPKETLAETTLENRLLKISMIADGEDIE
jgi:hypothetical protein